METRPKKKKKKMLLCVYDELGEPRFKDYDANPRPVVLQTVKIDDALALKEGLTVGTNYTFADFCAKHGTLCFHMIPNFEVYLKNPHVGVFIERDMDATSHELLASKKGVQAHEAAMQEQYEQQETTRGKKHGPQKPEETQEVQKQMMIRVLVHVFDGGRCSKPLWDWGDTHREGLVWTTVMERCPVNVINTYYKLQDFLSKLNLVERTLFNQKIPPFPHDCFYVYVEKAASEEPPPDVIEEKKEVVVTTKQQLHQLGFCIDVKVMVHVFDASKCTKPLWEWARDKEGLIWTTVINKCPVFVINTYYKLENPSSWFTLEQQHVLFSQTSCDRNDLYVYIERCPQEQEQQAKSETDEKKQDAITTNDNQCTHVVRIYSIADVLKPGFIDFKTAKINFAKLYVEHEPRDTIYICPDFSDLEKEHGQYIEDLSELNCRDAHDYLNGWEWKNDDEHYADLVDDSDDSDSDRRLLSLRFHLNFLLDRLQVFKEYQCVVFVEKNPSCSK